MAGTMVLTSATVIGKTNPPARIANAKELLVTWIADSADGSVPPLTLTDYAGWWITKVITNPGGTAPTALYDITCLDADGADIFAGELLNRSATVTERLIPLNFPQIGADGFTLAIANNLVNSATGTIRLFLNR